MTTSPSFRVPILAALLLVSASMVGQAKIEKSRAIRSIERDIERIMEFSDCPGMSVVVVEKGEIVFAKGFGYANIEAKLPADANTLFAIGSCTKAFTGTLIGQLNHEDLLDIDQSPQDYLPTLKFNTDDMNRLITIRDMLCHRTGLPRHDLSWYMFPSTSREELIARIQYQEPTAEVREIFQYNNFMYMALGALTESVSGLTWEENMHQRILGPLEMNTTNLHIDELVELSNIATGYNTSSSGDNMPTDFYHIRGMAPAGSINSNALDMGNWLIAWINGGEFRGDQVIPTSYLYEAISGQMATRSGFPGTKRPDLHMNDYGFAWSLSSYRGHYRVEHGGNIDGFSASTCFFPSDSIGIVVLVNQNYSRVPSLVRNVIADELLELKPGGWDEGLEKHEGENDSDENELEQVSDRIRNTRPSHDIEAYLGKFGNRGYGNFKVEWRNDSLMAILPERVWWLKHHHYDVFEPHEVIDGKVDTSYVSSVRLNFMSNTNGEIAGFELTVDGNTDPIYFDRQPTDLPLDLEQAARFEGEYDLGGVFAKVYIEEGTLKLFVPGQTDYSLIPSRPGVFKVKDLNGFSVEFEEKEGAIVAMKLIQPNGTFRVPRKE